MDTIFTKIINREIPAHILYEDTLVIAFLDISQVTKGHTLVVPKKVYPDFLSLPNDLAAHLFLVAQKIGHALQKAFEPKGFNLINNNGSVAGQTVFHFHLHIIPRYIDSEFKYLHDNNEVSRDTLKERADLIKSALS